MAGGWSPQQLPTCPRQGIALLAHQVTSPSPARPSPPSHPPAAPTAAREHPAWRRLHPPACCGSPPAQQWRRPAPLRERPALPAPPSTLLQCRNSRNMRVMWMLGQNGDCDRCWNWHHHHSCRRTGTHPPACQLPASGPPAGRPSPQSSAPALRQRPTGEMGG